MSFRHRLADFNPRSPHGERRLRRGYANRWRGISIHAPRTGSDPKALPPVRRSHTDFNPRSPHGERPRTAWRTPPRFLFQSTLPARGATILHELNHALRYFNPRSPHGERPPSLRPTRARATSFQSTLPARGATGAFQVSDALSMISIHAPRTGSDKRQREYYLAHRDFNPRSPHGERRASKTSILMNEMAFQSTLPARGATCRPVLRFHPPRHFNPRSPHGERHATTRVPLPVD